MVAAIVLAAGSGTRIGGPKALLETGTPGECFAARACQVLEAAGLHHVVVVAAETDAARLAPLLPKGVEIAINPRPDRGQLSSLQCGLAAIGATPRAVVVLPVDVALVKAATVRRLVETWQLTAAPVVRPVHGGRHGHPVLFDGRLFDALARLDAPDGAKSIVRAHASPAGEVDVDDQGSVTDIDTADDYHRAFHRPPRLVTVPQAR